MSESKKLNFAKKSISENRSGGGWKVLIVDDEEEVHTITISVLKHFTYDNRGIEFLHAYSGAEAKKLMKEFGRIPLVLLDVVMEKDDSGLEVARFIREELENNITQIILRTGQPGSAPEKEVISEYEINDYKEKTELTATKLFTIMLTSLRAFKNLMVIEKNRRGLEKIIDSTKTLILNQNETLFVQGVLTQMEALLHLDDDSLYLKHNGLSAVHRENDEYRILASTGSFEHIEELPDDVRDALDKAIENRESLFLNDSYVCYCRVNSEIEHLIYLQGCDTLTDTSKKMIKLFSSKVAIALENLYLNKEITETKREIIYTLGNVVESRSKETAFHVQRMSEVSYLLAKKCGMSEEEAILLRNASPMHDVGKVGIPDRILLKPARLDEDEYRTMKTHTQIGHDILKDSNRDLIRAAAIVAYQHHEKFDGSGYPAGLAGEGIHIYGRITILADIFDALYHQRCYKEAWPLEKIIDFFRAESGKTFDPALLEIFLENIDDIVEITEKYRNGQ